MVSVRFKRGGRVQIFTPGNLPLKRGEKVVVETARGKELGEVAMGPREVARVRAGQPLRPILRRATDADIAMDEEVWIQSQDALKIAKDKTAELALPMNLVRAEGTLDKSRLTFYFTAENRVDFRELVKLLASSFRTRIELRQIGVRDEARYLGGLGPCGRIICCHSFLGEFAPVSIKMAKGQNVALNPGKISGICGRLMCCLRFESYEGEERTASAAGVVVKPGGDQGEDGLRPCACAKGECQCPHGKG